MKIEFGVSVEKVRSGPFEGDFAFMCFIFSFFLFSSKKFDYVSHAVDRVLEPSTECASVSETMYVCTSCTAVSLSTTDVNCNTPPLTWIATLMQDS